MRRFGLDHYNAELRTIDSIPHHQFLAYARASALLVSTPAVCRKNARSSKFPW